MLITDASPLARSPAAVGSVFQTPAMTPQQEPADVRAAIAGQTSPDEELETVEWSEDDIVFLHWRLLQEVRHLADPAAPLGEKLDTLRWVFTEREKDAAPFSFVSCLRVVGCSPLSPIAYCGRVDAEEVRDQIRNGLRSWLGSTLQRYPVWVRQAVARNPDWIEAHLARNPQWINEQIKHRSEQGDLFG